MAYVKTDDGSWVNLTMARRVIPDDPDGQSWSVCDASGQWREFSCPADGIEYLLNGETVLLGKIAAAVEELVAFLMHGRARLDD